MLPLQEEQHLSCLEAFSSKMSAWVWFYPSALVRRAGKPFLQAPAIWGLPLEQSPAPAYTKTLAQGTVTEGGDCQYQQRNIRELLPHSGSLVPHRLSWGCVLWSDLHLSPWCTKAMYIPPWPAGVGWKQAGLLCFAACPLAGGAIKGQGVY